MRTVYGAPLSPFVRKVRVVLAEKGLPYELEPVLHYLVPGDFGRISRTISPLGKIPGYQDGDVALADSSVICAYLERTNPEPALYPSGPYEYARALWFEEYADTALASVLTAKIFFQNVVLPRLMSQPADDAALQQIVDEELPPLFDYLESQLVNGDTIVGTDFSIGDVGIATQFVNLRYYAGLDVDAARWPKLALYIERVHARPSFRALIDEEITTFGPLRRVAAGAKH